MAGLFRIVAAVSLLVGLLGCGGVQHHEMEPRGTVRFKGEPKDAHVEINEIHLGPLHMFEKSGVMLKPGKQRIIISKPGYFTVYRIVDVQVNTLQTVEVNLREIP